MTLCVSLVTGSGDFGRVAVYSVMGRKGVKTTSGDRSPVTASKSVFDGCNFQHFFWQQSASSRYSSLSSTDLLPFLTLFPSYAIR